VGQKDDYLRATTFWQLTSSKRLDQFAWFLANFSAVLFWTHL